MNRRQLAWTGLESIGEEGVSPEGLPPPPTPQRPANTTLDDLPDGENMRERTIELAALRHAKSQGYLLIKLWPTMAGLPDRLLLMPGGRSIFLEFKNATGRVSPIQKARIAQFAALGHEIRVVRNLIAFKALLASLRDKSP